MPYRIALTPPEFRSVEGMLGWQDEGKASTSILIEAWASPVSIFV